MLIKKNYVHDFAVDSSVDTKTNQFHAGAEQLMNRYNATIKYYSNREEINLGISPVLFCYPVNYDLRYNYAVSMEGCRFAALC